MAPFTQGWFSCDLGSEHTLGNQIFLCFPSIHLLNHLLKDVSWFFTCTWSHMGCSARGKNYVSYSIRKAHIKRPSCLHWILVPLSKSKFKKTQSVRSLMFYYKSIPMGKAFGTFSTEVQCWYQFCMTQVLWPSVQSLESLGSLWRNK